MTAVLCVHLGREQVACPSWRHTAPIWLPRGVDEGRGGWGHHPPTSATVSSTTSVSSGRASCCCREVKRGFRKVRAKASIPAQVPRPETLKLGRVVRGRSPRLCLRGEEGTGDAKHGALGSSAAPPFIYLYVGCLRLGVEKHFCCLDSYQV